jgi:hypothetical protein
MSHSSLNPSLRAVTVAALFSAAQDVGEHETGVVDMADFANVQLVATVGAFGSGASGTLKFEQSKTADFIESKDIENRTAVDVVAFMPVVIDLSQGELDIDNNYQYVRAVLAATTESITAGLVVLGFDPRHAPATPMDGVVVDTRAS